MSNETPQKSLSQLVEELRSYQAELEAQNEALRYSRIAAEGASERFESLFSNVPLALMVVDELGMVVQSNAMALRLFRPQEYDPPLNFLLPLVDEAHLERVGRCFNDARRNGNSEVTEVVFLRGSEGTLTGDLHMARIEYSQDDEMAHFICAVIDQGPLLAERHALQESAEALRQRNEALHLSENRMAAIINSSLDAIICVDADQRISVFNPAAAALFQCPAMEAMNSSLARFLPDAMPAIAATQVSSHTRLDEVSGLTANGQPLTLEVSVSCERHPQGNITTLFARDLTARKAMEAQLRESHKMQAIGTMAGGIAHDFNNILGAILGNAALAMEDAGPDSPAQVSLAQIEKAGQRARDLVRQILTFSRNEAPRRDPVKLADVVQECKRLLKVTLPTNLKLQAQIDADTPDVLADSTQVGQALFNLCTNAIHAMGSKRGTVRIELGHAHLDTLQAEPLGLLPGHYATLTVRDTGTGIDPATLQRLFEPFFTTKQVGQGTGLGLAVVHGVMRTHMGTVDVQSTPGAGSAFTLYFPALDEAVEPVEPAPVKTRRPASGNTASGHVMYVDDDQALVFLMQRALSRKGLKVSTYTDPQQALAALRDNPADIDLLVTDYNMPGYSGVDLLRDAAAIRPGLPVALASGYVTPEIEQAAQAAGARALIHKPNDVEEMCETVQRLLRGEPTAAPDASA
ncbi:MAG: ATP-binding protein [Pseudomonadota bacterium]|jgi:PAS domain S-box-containing protein|uniref:PAS domain-containing hybrid sensor histidine kinase/response regulator n=1 Tax=Curvibacter delicatus TaxID=80879 RepID=UPI0008348E11|nr:PAS domain-containing sensor histidine kinase [Curvibacter delicatus]MEA3394361.1 ATP-binding protein [Pseudomonadota bacterium]